MSSNWVSDRQKEEDWEIELVRNWIGSLKFTSGEAACWTWLEFGSLELDYIWRAALYLFYISLSFFLALVSYAGYMLDNRWSISRWPREPLWAIGKKSGRERERLRRTGFLRYELVSAWTEDYFLELSSSGSRSCVVGLSVLRVSHVWKKREEESMNLKQDRGLHTVVLAAEATTTTTSWGYAMTLLPSTWYHILVMLFAEASQFTWGNILLSSSPSSSSLSLSRPCFLPIMVVL